MSTRSTIAVYTDRQCKKWKGVYCHWDGYPSGVGQTLWNAYRNTFKGDLVSMLRLLIHEHPAGWSAIVDRDFTKSPAWLNWNYDDGVTPLSYSCRGDEAWSITQKDDTWCEWSYVFNLHDCTMTIYRRGHGFKVRWIQVAIVWLDDQEPDWQALDSVDV